MVPSEFKTLERNSGRIVHTGEMRHLAADEALQQRLLGLSLDTHQ